MSKSKGIYQVQKEHKIIDGIEHRQCVKCEEWLPTSDFGSFKRAASPRGLNYRCKACHNERRRNRYIQVSGEKERENKKRVTEFRLFKKNCINYKAAQTGVRGCLDCNQQHIENYNECIFDFHHRNPQHKDFNIGEGKSRLFENVKKELDKCDMICSNCHRIRHSKEIRKYKYVIGDI